MRDKNRSLALTRLRDGAREGGKFLLTYKSNFT